MNPFVEQIRAIPMFSECSEQQLEQILTRSSIVSYKAGETIHGSSESSEFFWILLEGKWRNTRQVRGTSEPLHIERDGVGTWFGGIEFVDTVAPMQAVALADSTFLRIPRATMTDFIRQGFPLYKHLMRGVQAGMGWFLQHLEKEQS